MRGPKHERRWASDTIPGKTTLSTGTSPGADSILLKSLLKSPLICRMMTLLSSGVSSRPRLLTSKMELERKLRSFAGVEGGGCGQGEAVLTRIESRAKEVFLGPWNEAKVLSASPSNGGGGGGGGFESALEARALRKQRAQLDRTRSGAQKALRGLRFISNSKTNGVDAWNEVQSNYEKLAKDGYLYRADFAQCIGMRDSKEFALELFDALGRRRRLKVDKINRDELYEFWSQITDQSFDSRLQIFFDMYALSNMINLKILNFIIH
ncbi:hypothetical protein GH714_010732 [Hevea brasiliensis]|uniref:NADPH oxidase Respiratory burst domain-containing protein n=1 Tax=Hevea brasiliensis TaxID=3981 RepID=A0A6A6MHY5_HEVBR|nr:hypothetical protein GH714_010732 [Hevea brasiliensis]